MAIPLVHTRFSTPRQKDYFDQRRDFSTEVIWDYKKFEKPVLVTKSYDGLDDEEEHEMIPIVNQNNNYCNTVSDSESKSEDNEGKENVFDKDIDKEVKATPTINAKVVQAMKKLQALYNDNANKNCQESCKQKMLTKI